MIRVLSLSTRGTMIAGLATVLAAAGFVAEATAQTMPAPVYYELVNNGYEKLANRISKKLEFRSNPDDDDVQSLLDRWEREEGGPDSGWDYITVARLWLRAGSAAEAEMALIEAEELGEVAAPMPRRSTPKR